ncbi:MAG TPA: hypothetical protein VE173_01990, partial [Longimicrobiales bacterium]|nr:hypothetical protein [Longimicrobiales bacterium]
MKSSLILALAASLVVPLPGSAQTATRASNDVRDDLDGDALARVFQAAVEEISTRHREGFTAPELWSMTLDGILASRE